jgi:DNA-binding phage protein
MTKRKIIAAAALSAAVATGGIVGATLGTPSISGAQDNSTTTEPSTDGTTTPDEGAAADEGFRRGRGGHGLGGGIALDTAAETLGITEDELRTALDEGKTLAEIAEEQGVERQALIDALVAAGEARLDEAKAALPERMAEAVDRTFEGRGDRGDRFPILSKGLTVAAETLGMTEDELRTALREDDKTLAQVAEEQGVERQVLVDALVADANARLAEKVADGSITQEQADRRAETLTEAVERMIDGEGFGRGGPRGN